MKIRNEWMTDKDYFGENYPNNMLLDSAIRRFEIQKQSLEGKDAKVDGINERIVAQQHTNPLNQSKYDMKLSFNMSSNVHTGSIIEFDGKKWIVVSKIYDNQAYKTASVVECNNSIAIGSAIVPISIVSDVQLYRMRIDEGKYFDVPEGSIVVKVPYSDTTKNIKRSTVFNLIDDDNYIVWDINKVIEPGIIIWVMQYTTEQPSPIPTPEPSQPINIIGESSIIKNQQKEYTTDYDGEGELTFSLEGTAASIVSQNGTKCVVKAGASVGIVILTVTDGEISGEKEIRVKSILGGGGA